MNVIHSNRDGRRIRSSLAIGYGVSEAVTSEEVSVRCVANIRAAIRNCYGSVSALGYGRNRQRVIVNIGIVSTNVYRVRTAVFRNCGLIVHCVRSVLNVIYSHIDSRGI